MIAHLLIGDRETAAPWIAEYANKNHIPPQFHYMIEPTEKELSIAQVRELQRETAYRVPEGRLFVIDRFDTASVEAQNAMLKMLEQPQEHDHFVLICASEQAAIPTIRSRVRSVRLNAKVAQKPAVARQDLSQWRTITTDDAAQAYIDEAIAYEREQSADMMNTAHLRRLITLRQLIHNHVTPQSIADSVTLLYRS